MARAKRTNPHDPAKAHGRRSRDLPRNAEVAAAEVDDPLGRMHSHRHFDEAQYQGGRAFQADWEKAERGPQAEDPTREYVMADKCGSRSPKASARPCCG